MGKEVDFEALAAQYVWGHLRRMNMSISALRRWKTVELINRQTKVTVLFTMHFTSVKEKVREEIDLPVAILTEDGILRFLIGSGEVDLKQGEGNPFKSIG